MASSNWTQRDPVLRAVRGIGLVLFGVLAVFVAGEAADWTVPEPLVEALPGCGPGWERRWASIEEGRTAEEVTECLGAPEETRSYTFDSTALVRQIQAMQSGEYMGPGPDTFFLGRLRAGEEYEVWTWKRQEVTRSWTEEPEDVRYHVTLTKPEGGEEERVLRKDREEPMMDVVY